MIGRPIGELKEGQTAELTRKVTLRMIQDFSRTIGDDNPIHSDKVFANSVSFAQPIAPGVMTAGMISAAIGTLLPGPGTLYMSQELKFLRPVLAGDDITARVEVVELVADKNRVRLKTVCVNQRGEEVLVGEAWVKPPKQRIVYEEGKRTAPAPIPDLPLAFANWAMQMWSTTAHTVLAGWRQALT